MNERNLLNAWGRINERWDKWAKLLWVAWGCHLPFTVLYILDRVPEWAWLVSFTPWLIVLGINFGFIISTNEINQEFK